MQQRGLSGFADRFAEVAADTDYSRKPALQSTSSFDITAAAEALWRDASRRGVDLEELASALDSAAVERALEAQVRRYDDEDELVSVEFEEYWDATDEKRFSSMLLEQMKEELARTFLSDKKGEGMIVVNNHEGIWLFKFESGS